MARDARDILTTPLSRYRVGPQTSKDAPPAVSREGGLYKAGLIRGASVIARGEAKGHGEWIDGELLDQVTAAINQAEGVKSRFAHPGLSGDGLGKALGVFRTARRDGDRVLADLHFFETAHQTPDGDLAEYVMGFAEESPEHFGVSIAFKPDYGAMKAHEGEHSDDDGNFTSPDPQNIKNYPHIRMAELYAADVVDEPAANPDGLFHRGQEIAVEAEALAEFVLGLSDAPPALAALDVDPDRILRFARGFLDRHGLRIVRDEPNDKEKDMADDKHPTPVDAEAQQALGRKAESDRFKALRARFGDDPAFVAEQFEAGRTVEEAEGLWQKRQIDTLTEANAALSAENADLKAKIEQLEAAGGGKGGAAVPFKGGDDGDGDFYARAQALSASENIKLDEAMRKLASAEPEAYRAYKRKLAARG